MDVALVSRRPRAQTAPLPEMVAEIRVGHLDDGRVYFLLGDQPDDVLITLDDIKRCCGSLARESLDRWIARIFAR